MKKAQQSERNARLIQVLDAAKKVDRAAEDGNMKRRTNEFLARYLSVSVASQQSIRPVSGYRSHNYNRARQVLALVEHLFVKYPVPLFLYRSVLSYQGLQLVFNGPAINASDGRRPPEAIYRDWFLTVALGKSFAKASKDVFTKREAHWFLLAPVGNTIPQNILWAKAAAAGIPTAGCDYLVERFDATMVKRIGERLPDILRFYAEAWPEMRAYDRVEITDFVRAAAQDQTFSFKGRTFGSMRKLSHEWHRVCHVGRVGDYRTWPVKFPRWEFQKSGRIVRAHELTNSRAMAEEGEAQGHCVYTYTSQCIQGLSSIVTFRWFGSGVEGDPSPEECNRLTVEIAAGSREVVQIRGKRNRRATTDEMKVIRNWAADNGLKIGNSA